MSMPEKGNPTLYEMHGSYGTRYAYGLPWISMALFMDDIHFPTPEEAMKWWNDNYVEVKGMWYERGKEPTTMTNMEKFREVFGEGAINKAISSCSWWAEPFEEGDDGDVYYGNSTADF